MGDDIVSQIRKIASRGRMDDADVQVVFDAADEIERLQRTVKDRDEWNDHLASRESSLLLAVPRPFRMAVNRKAVRLLEEEARRG